MAAKAEDRKKEGFKGAASVPAATETVSSSATQKRAIQSVPLPAYLDEKHPSTPPATPVLPVEFRDTLF